MKFVVYDRGTMMKVPAANASWALISINEEGDFPIVNTNDQLVERLNLKFHDIDRANPRDLNGRILFNSEMAGQVLDFYQSMKDKGVELMFVHCNMGMCRSPAVAAALQLVDQMNDHIWFATKRPNALVYRLIVDEAAARGMLD
jgi:predicted protein tyrosine phosphatase